MNRSLVSRLFLCLGITAIGSGCVNAEPDSRRAPVLVPSAVVPSALQAAHEAYLDADWLAMGERIRDVLLDPTAGELAHENAFELLDGAYEVTGGKLPSSFKRPADYQFISYGQMHDINPGGPRNAIFVKARMRDASHVTGVTVRRLPDKTLLDSNPGKDTYKLEHDEPGFEDITVEVVVAELPADGVFTLRIGRDDVPATEGWFIARRMNSTTVPEVRSPVPSESFSERNPVMSWVPFRSPQFATYERRSLYVSVSADDDAKGKPDAWGFWTGEPGELAQVRIGDHPGTDKISLEPGNDWALLGCVEMRSFGGVQLKRVSRRGGPFRVLRPEPRADQQR
jgi:hypothetical protein